MSTVRGVVWNLAQHGGGRLIGFVATVVLARLLEPEAFGLLAMGLLAINVFDRLKDLGVGSALVQTRLPFGTVAPTAATLTMISAAVLAAGCLLGAEPLALLLGDHRLVPVIQALSGALLISGLAVLPDAWLRRRLLFRDRAVPEVSGAVIKAVVSIGLALTGGGVWSLVWGQLAGAAVTTGLYWVVHRRRASGRVLGWSTPTAKALVSYGLPISGVSLLALILDNLDYFVIGRRLGAEQLGVYTMAFRIPELLVISVCAVIGQVLFSSFARVQDDPDALRREYLAVTATVAALAVPVGVGLAATAPEIVTVVLGPRFGEATTPLRLLGLCAAVYALSFHAGEVYKATGRTRLMIILSVIRLIIFAPALWWAAGHSIVAVAGTLLGLQLIFTLVRLGLIRSVLGLRIADQWHAIWPALLAAGLAGGAVFGLSRLVTPVLSTGPRLVILAMTGAALYLILLTRFDRTAVSRLRRLAGARRGER
ncbi:lipopolysaccharide biosynthesis protein [Microlunatus sp. GCM10028923]|uniref:lipopolysaccharide biosynthesis protein n=1 Tax=Microlunatus sp. GCM10028923 TaxID=3273400 RepID=UPI0036083422